MVLRWRDTGCENSIHKTRTYQNKYNSIHAVSPNQQTTAKQKPVAALEYNERNSDIVYSDQIVSYGTVIRKGIKSYQKLRIQLPLGISVVNALILNKRARKKG